MTGRDESSNMAQVAGHLKALCDQPSRAPQLPSASQHLRHHTNIIHTIAVEKDFNN